MKKYICTNCDSVPNNKDVEPMLKAGFGLKHVNCPVCGQQSLCTQAIMRRERR